MFIYSELPSRLFKVLLALVLSMLLTNSYAGPKYWPAQKGQVLDAESGEPLADVFVIKRYWGNYVTLGTHHPVCYHAAGTMTNEQGIYEFPHRFDIMDTKFDKRSKINVYQIDYRHVFYKDGIAKLEKDQGTREERLEELKRIMRNSNCGGAGQTQQSLFPFHEAIYIEAKAISETMLEKEQLDWFRRVAASKAIASDGDQFMDGGEYDLKTDEYLKDHLQ